MKHSFLRVLAALCLVMAVARVAIAADEQGQWKKIVSTRGNFSVLMPGVPTEEKQSDGSFFGLEKDGLVMAVVYNDHPNGDIEKLKPQVLLDAARDGVLKEDGGKKSKLLNERKVSLGNLTGKEFRAVTTDDVLLRVRVFLVKRRLYQVLVGMPRKSEKEFGKQTEKFLESFKLVAPPKSS
jgi:hypothetical protein